MKSKPFELLTPDVERDAPFAHSWFMRPEGHQTLLSMGNADYRGKGLGLFVMQSVIEYIRINLNTRVICSRHLSSNGAIATVLQKLGFEVDGASYADENGLVWQNVKLVL